MNLPIETTISTRRPFAALQSEEIGNQLRAGAILAVTESEIEEAVQIPADFVVGVYYTNTHGEYYRCMDFQGTRASLLLFKSTMGDRLDIEVGTEVKNAEHFWPILDSAVLENLEKRHRQHFSRVKKNR